MNRINTSRQTISAKQRVNNYRPSGAIAQHVLNSTVAASGLTAKVSIRRAGRSFTVGSLQIRKGDRIILVASPKFAGRYYVCSHGQWSTNDPAVIAKCRQVILQIEKRQVEKLATTAAQPVVTYRKEGILYHVVYEDEAAGKLVSIPVGRVEVNPQTWEQWRDEMVAYIRKQGVKTVA